MSEDRILLHTCCGPCSTVAVPWWRAEGLEPEALFVNPNIQPDAEYLRRRAAMEAYAEVVGLTLTVDETPAFEMWDRAAGSEAMVPVAAAGRPAAAMTGGTGAVGPHPGTRDRCRACLVLRLRETATTAAERGLMRFSTSLTVSPYQHHDLITDAGRLAADQAGVEFVYADLRRHYRRSVDESRRLGLYRQRYCGCVPSKWESWAQTLERRRRRRTAA
jgi:predicted adenine nucleotide alpha hydrolase (AANH) superfamily ATPase